MALNRIKLRGKLSAHVKNEKESEFPDGLDATGWDDGEGMLISTNEAEYICRLVVEDLHKNAHEICGCSRCKPDDIFPMLCSETGKFIPQGK